MDADGSNRRQVSSPSGFDLGPVWSPDGKRLAYTSRADGSQQLWVMNADGSARRQITHDPLGVSGADWSPDGSQLVYANLFYADGTIHVVAADGSAARSFSPAGLRTGVPAWSPDGSRIAFSVVVGTQWHLAFMNADGTGVTVTSTTATNPAWSPDGTKLAYFLFVPAPAVPGGVASIELRVDSTVIARVNAPGGRPTWQVHQAPVQTTTAATTASATTTGAVTTTPATTASTTTGTGAVTTLPTTASTPTTTEPSTTVLECVVPDVVGKTLAAARAALDDANCAPGAVKTVYSAKKKGTVVAQSPAAHSVHAEGASVALTVSKGPKPR